MPTTTVSLEILSITSLHHNLYARATLWSKFCLPQSKPCCCVFDNFLENFLESDNGRHRLRQASCVCFLPRLASGLAAAATFLAPNPREQQLVHASSCSRQKQLLGAAATFDQQLAYKNCRLNNSVVMRGRRAGYCHNIGRLASGAFKLP